MRISAKCLVFKSLTRHSNWTIDKVKLSSIAFAADSISASSFSCCSAAFYSSSETLMTETTDVSRLDWSSFSFRTVIIEFIDISSFESVTCDKSVSPTSNSILTSSSSMALSSSLFLSSSVSVRMDFYFCKVCLMLDACTFILPSRPDISDSSCWIKFDSKIDFLIYYYFYGLLFSIGMSTIGRLRSPSLISSLLEPPTTISLPSPPFYSSFNELLLMTGALLVSS